MGREEEGEGKERKWMMKREIVLKGRERSG